MSQQVIDLGIDRNRIGRPDREAGILHAAFRQETALADLGRVFILRSLIRVRKHPVKV